MSERRRIEDRIRKKEQEIQGLEEEIKAARIYVQALQDVLRMFPRDQRETDSSPTTLRAGSGVAQAREAILREGKPLHISVLLQKVGKEPTREARISLSGSLAAYVRKGEMFSRPAPNTFGLIELGHASDPLANDPPENFGSEVTDEETDGKKLPF
jgi:hypothetical protein